MKLLKDIEFSSADVEFKIKGVSLSKITGNINLGAVTLTCKGREFILDSYYTDFWAGDSGKGRITDVRCKLEIDEEVFPEGYTMLVEDLFDKELTGTFYCDFEEEIYEKAKASDFILSIRYGLQTITIPLKNEI